MDRYFSLVIISVLLCPQVLCAGKSEGPDTNITVYAVNRKDETILISSSEKNLTVIFKPEFIRMELLCLGKSALEWKYTFPHWNKNENSIEEAGDENIAKNSDHFSVVYFSKRVAKLYLTGPYEKQTGKFFCRLRKNRGESNNYVNILLPGQAIEKYITTTIPGSKQVTPQPITFGPVASSSEAATLNSSSAPSVEETSSKPSSVSSSEETPLKPSSASSSEATNFIKHESTSAATISKPNGKNTPTLKSNQWSILGIIFYGVFCPIMGVASLGAIVYFFYGRKKWV